MMYPYHIQAISFRLKKRILLLFQTIFFVGTKCYKWGKHFDASVGQRQQLVPFVSMAENYRHNLVPVLFFICLITISGKVGGILAIPLDLGPELLSTGTIFYSTND